jgi:hypothetical protein
MPCIAAKKGAGMLEDTMVDCLVAVDGRIAESLQYADLVRVCFFRDYVAPTTSGSTESLLEYLSRNKSRIEASDPTALEDMHQAFLPVVQKIMDGGLYSSKLGGLETHVGRVGRFSKAKVRGCDGEGSMYYANYMHNDAWLSPDADSVGMVNVW